MDTTNMLSQERNKEEKMGREDKKIIVTIANILARENDITYEEQLRILELLQKEKSNS